jgi:hypothetical protein
MKRKNISWLLAMIIMSCLLPSCFKKFDPDSYAPPLNIGGYTSAKEIAPANLIAYWAFNGGYVDSVSGTAGVNTGTSFAPAIKGQGFQGALNSYMLFEPTNAIRTMTSFTIAFWVKSPAPSTGIIGLVNLSKTDGFWGNIDIFFENGSSNTNGKFRAHIQKGASEAWVSKDGIQNMFDSWIHLTLSYDATTSTFKLYKDGGLINTSTSSLGPLAFTNIGKMVFGTVHFQTTPSQTTGSGQQGWASFLTGQMDEVRIYNKALTDAEVNSLVKLEGRGK